MTEVQRLQEMQERLQKAEASLARLLNHLPGTAYRCRITDGYAYVLEFISKGCEAMLGKAPTEFLGQNLNVIERMMSDEDLLNVRRAMQDSILKRKPYRIFYRITLPGTGEQKWIWDQGEGVHDDSGQCWSVEGIMMDVTEQKNRELHLKEENRQLRTSIKNSYGLGNMIGKSEVMQHCYRLLLRAAKSDTNVVLQGETGVGKDLAACTIHELSGVSGRFVPVNCAAIPEQLMESEFFGHVKGAFSGAVANHTGFLAAANGGTLFLDEVGELPLRLQGKLLRALESKTYTPVGSNDVKQASFRLISATNRNLMEQVREKEMRADFYYRIHVLSIVMPPLRERRGDLALLVDAYARERGAPSPLSPSIMLGMEQYHWPGNVRELQNALDRYWAFGELGLDFGPVSNDLVCIPASRLAPEAPENSVKVPLTIAREELEKQRIRAVLDQNGWRKGQTAEALGLTMRTLQRKLKRYGISR